MMWRRVTIASIALGLCLQGCAGAGSVASEPPLLPAALVAPAATEAPAATPLPTPSPEPVRPLSGRRICLDPGHDAYWTPGAAGRDAAGRLGRHPSGIALNEHELTLAVAYRAKDLLEAEGASVCVTRRPVAEGGGLQRQPADFNGDGLVRTRGQAVEDEPERIQPRIDWANEFGAEVLISIHFNGSEDRTVRGTEVYFTDGGPRREDGRRLAAAMLESLLAELRASGFAAVDRGVKSDAYQRYTPAEMARLVAANAATIRSNGADPGNCPTCYRLFTTGNNPMSVRPGRYVGVLLEVEFLSNPDVVQALFMRADLFDIVANGIVRGVTAYFALP
jgi:N-acetylmuramoyl-L-alanine amidase